MPPALLERQARPGTSLRDETTPQRAPSAIGRRLHPTTQNHGEPERLQAEYAFSCIQDSFDSLDIQAIKDFITKLAAEGANRVVSPQPSYPACRGSHPSALISLLRMPASRPMTPSIGAAPDQLDA